MEPPRQQAHLRFPPFQNSFTFTFNLLYKDESFELNKSFHITQTATFTIREFFEQLANRIVKILEKNEQLQNKENINHEVKTYVVKPIFKSKSKLVPVEYLVKQLENYKNLYFTVLETTYKVIINSPNVESIKLPEIIYHGNTVAPCQIKSVLVSHELSKYYWYRSKDKINWTKVAETYFYNVNENDVNYYLKLVCYPKNEDHEGVPYEVVSQNVIESLPEVPYCPFEERHKLTKGFASRNIFRVVSYNTLSSRYTYSQYQYCPIKYLSIDYRKQVLMKELVGYNADIMCLQEVDNNIYSYYFRDEFKKLGYNSIYNKKGNRIPEGLAIIYNKDKFSFGGQGHIVFSMEVKTNPCLRSVLSIIEKDVDLKDVFMRQATSMQYVKLKSKTLNQMLIVANTHLYYHPDAANVRLIQTVLCLEYLKNMYNKEFKSNKRLNISVIFCGDFNSTPTSDVCKFMLNGSVQYEDSKCATTLFHPFQMSSACGMPQYTNYTNEFKACLDYIFFENNLECVSYVPLPDEAILCENVALPSQVFPSDHVALIADLKFKNEVDCTN